MQLLDIGINLYEMRAVEVMKRLLHNTNVSLVGNIPSEPSRAQLENFLVRLTVF